MITFILYIFITDAVRELRKREMRKQMETGSKQSLFIVTTEDIAGQVVDHMLKNNYARYRMAGIAVIDNSVLGHRIHGGTCGCRCGNSRSLYLSYMGR